MSVLGFLFVCFETGSQMHEGAEHDLEHLALLLGLCVHVLTVLLS